VARRLRALTGLDAERIVVVLAAFSFVAVTIEVMLADDPGNVAVGIAAVALLCLAFAASPRYPLQAATVLAVTLAASSLLGSHMTYVSGFILIPLVGTLFTWGLRAPNRGFWLSLPLVYAGVLVAVINDAADAGDEVAASIAFVSIVFFTAPVGAGRMMRWRAQTNRRLEQQAEELERNREARARAARLATRTSIANELHDIVAHEVSVMVVQAQAARRGVERGRADAAASIEAIEATGREALNEMRRLLGVLRHEDEGIALPPQPSLRSVDELVEMARDFGIDVHMDTDDLKLDELPSSVELAGYRIAQEALLSGHEAGDVTRIDARLATRAGTYEMDLSADGPIALATLAGLQERVGMFGGSIEIEPHGRGGTLRIRIPLNRSYAGARP
jgi:signal transduction histidine kinase